MASRKFTQANNGLLYCNLNTTFRVGATAILHGYVSAQEDSVKSKQVNDPYAPVQLELENTRSNRKTKVSGRSILNAVEEKLKNHGYQYFEDITVSTEYFDQSDIDYLSNLFPDLSAEFAAYFGASEETETNSGIEM